LHNQLKQIKKQKANERKIQLFDRQGKKFEFNRKKIHPYDFPPARRRLCLRRDKSKRPRLPQNEVL